MKQVRLSFTIDIESGVKNKKIVDALKKEAGQLTENLVLNGALKSYKNKKINVKIREIEKGAKKV